MASFKRSGIIVYPIIPFDDRYSLNKKNIFPQSCKLKKDVFLCPKTNEQCA